MELLVVITIISMLAMAIFAVAFNARKESRDLMRVSVSEQYKLSVRLYKEAEGQYPSFPNGVQLGGGDALDALLFPFIREVKKDPLDSGPGSEYSYWYYSNFSCNGETRNVILVRTMEEMRNSNFKSVCGSFNANTGLAGDSSYVVPI